MIKGVGIDIVKIKRIEEMAKNYGEKFLERVYSQEELAYSMSFKKPFERLAGKFAAKEAIMKASGTKIPLNKIEILNSKSGKPYTNINNIKISISHEQEYAIAIAIYEEE
jgi:holo-[acyl-carrier protein] synthase